MRIGAAVKAKDLVGVPETTKTHDQEVAEVMTDLAEWYWAGARFIEEQVKGG